MLKSISLRHGYAAGFLCCVALMAAAFYFEYVMYLDPCPLCMLQRIATVLTGVGFLMAFFLHPKMGQQPSWGLRLALLFTFAACLFGLWSADHHVWLQGLPPEDVPACAPSFEYLLQTLPLTELLSIMFQGDGNCAEVGWSLWGLSMPAWLRLWFIGFTAATVFALFKTRPAKQG